MVYLQFKSLHGHPIRSQGVKKLRRIVSMWIVLHTIETMVHHLLALEMCNHPHVLCEEHRSRSDVIEIVHVVF